MSRKATEKRRGLVDLDVMQQGGPTHVAKGKEKKDRPRRALDSSRKFIWEMLDETFDEALFAGEHA